MARGNNPDRQLRSLYLIRGKGCWTGPTARRLALKHHPLKKRNSSLVKRFCAYNVPGLKSDTEAADFQFTGFGRGAFLQR